MTPCGAEKAAANEDGCLQCHLTPGHLGPHFDGDYLEGFTTPGTDPA